MSTTLGIAAWNGQISTTCDFAEQLVVIGIDHGRELTRRVVTLEEEPTPRRARRIQWLAVDVLLCGTISSPLDRMLSEHGIVVVPYVSGSVDEVLAAYLCNHLARPQFLQPGCRSSARRRWRHNMRRRAHHTGG